MQIMNQQQNNNRTATAKQFELTAIENDGLKSALIFKYVLNNEQQWSNESNIPPNAQLICRLYQPHQSSQYHHTQHTGRLI